MSRESMRQHTNNSQQRINGIVEHIYNCTVNHAKTTTNTTYNHQIPKLSSAYDPFYSANMPEILTKLKKLFPMCLVTHTLLAQGSNGKLYDISKIDDTILPYISSALENSYIIIDWT